MCQHGLISVTATNLLLSDICTKLKNCTSNREMRQKRHIAQFSEEVSIPDKVFLADWPGAEEEYKGGNNRLLLLQPMPAKPTDVHRGSLRPLRAHFPDLEPLSAWEKSEKFRRYVALLEKSSHGFAESTLVGELLQQKLLPLGVRIPQTTIPVHQPFAPGLVLPPSGLGLEWCLEAVRNFLAPHKDEKAPSSVQHLRLLIRYAFMRVLGNYQDSLEAQIQGSRPKRQVMNDLFPWSRVCTDLERSTVPAVSLVLGLLLGLEASWASPLAPKAPHQHFSMDSKSPNQLGRGLFRPVAPAVMLDCELLEHQHSKVEQTSRSVDTRSQLYDCTGELLSILQKLCHRMDYLEMANQCKDDPERLCRLLARRSTPCLLNLASLVTPRELTILISDVRRNLRLRSYLNVRKQLSDKPYESRVAYSFLTIGLVNALCHVYIRQDAIAEAFGWLLHSLGLTKMLSPKLQRALEDTIKFDSEEMNSEEDNQVQEIDIDGEKLIVIPD
ncbi:hypothetical protein Ciccas_001641 [Cichlidogyrus casuarinus]|uniref:Uncharacterized protein n=1 Tax=Cichlidogyrus casuarinus TaxID=1844966 RepID=A0ABD2QJF9_9PLAT